MNDQLTRLNDVFRHVLEDDELCVTPETTMQEVEGWDSLTLVTLMIFVEKSFKVRFSSSDSARLTRVGDLLDLIQAKSVN